MTVLNYSTSPDISLEEGILNIYLPGRSEFKSLIQALYDLKEPTNEYFDSHAPNFALVAAEWYFEAGKQILKKLAKRSDFKKIFAENMPKIEMVVAKSFSKGK